MRKHRQPKTSFALESSGNENKRVISVFVKVASILHPHQKERPNKVNYDEDDYQLGYLDSKDFALFSIEVKDAIDNIYLETDRPVSIADIKRYMGENYIIEWMMDALMMLKGVGSIEQVTEVSPLRYAPKEIPKVKKLNYMNRHSPKTEPKPDLESLYPDTYEKI